MFFVFSIFPVVGTLAFRPPGFGSYFLIVTASYIMRVTASYFMRVTASYFMRVTASYLYEGA